MTSIREQQRELRAELSEAHRHLRRAQDIAYINQVDPMRGPVVRGRIRRRLNIAQNIVIKLIVNEEWPK